MDKTKMEIVKDLATAVHGLKVNTQIAYEDLLENLNQDYGLYQVIALLELAYRDLNKDIEIMESLQHGINTDPNRTA